MTDAVLNKKRSATEMQAGIDDFAARKKRRSSPERNGEPSVPRPSDYKGKGKEKGKVTSGGKDRKKRKRKPRSTVIVADQQSPNESAHTLVPSEPEAAATPLDNEASASGLPSTPNTQLVKESSPVPNRGMEEVQAEIARLKKELQGKNELLEKQHDASNALHNVLQCQICFETMWDPYITSCGHTACLNCLKEWFTAPAPHEEPQPPVHLRRKTCPSCRGAVWTRPIPVFLVKGIIGVAKTHFGLLDGGDAQPAARVNDANNDPWTGIFSAAPTHGHRHNGGHMDGVVEDAEDNVLRCADCLYEIMDGICQGCGRVFDDLRSDDEEDEVALDQLLFRPNHHFPPFHQGHYGHNPYDDIDGASGDESTGSEMDDFIDDEIIDVDASENEVDDHSDLHSIRDSRSPPYQRRPGRRRNPIVISDDEGREEGWSSDGEGSLQSDDSEDPNEERPFHSDEERDIRRRQALERERFMHGGGLYPEREGGDFGQPGPSNIRHLPVGARIFSDDDEPSGDESEELDDTLDNPHPLQRRRRVLSDDEEDDRPSYYDGHDQYDDEGYDSGPDHRQYDHYDSDREGDHGDGFYGDDDDGGGWE